MPAASGVFKQIAIKAETTYGVLPAASGAQLLRRVEFATNLQKDSYESNEIRTDLQVADMRHGVRRVAGTLSGELSPGSYSPYLAALLKRDFSVVTAIASLSLTIAASGSNWTITRAAGSWLTDGIKVGMVGRISAGSVNAANLNKNLFVIGVTALALTVIVLNGSAMVAEGPIASCTFTLPGKYTYIPTSGHTDKSWALEEWQSDISQSEVFTGIKFTQASISLPPTGMATISLPVAGKDLGQKGGVRYFTSPTALSSTGVVAAVNGVLRINDTTQVSVTGLNFDINANFTGDPVVGQNVVPNQFAGRVRVSGQFTAYFEDGALRDAFIDESQIGIFVAMTTGNGAADDFISFAISRVKLGSADKADGEGGVVRTYSFTGLLNTSGGTGTAHEATTIAIQDSQAA